MLYGISRKTQNNLPSELPAVVVDSIKELLLEAFSSFMQERQLGLTLLSQLYGDELVVVATLKDSNQLSTLPASFFVSIDWNEKNAEILLESAGTSLQQLLDIYFSDPEWNDFYDDWQELSGSEVFVKINREDVVLTMQANSILRAISSEPEDALQDDQLEDFLTPSP